MEKTLPFSVFLIKKAYPGYTDCLNDEDHLTEYPLSEDLGFEGALFVGPQMTRQPQWVPFLEEGTDMGLDPILNSSTRAVLFIGTKTGTLAWTFGFGRHLLKEECYEKDFGLKVTLNSVDPQKLRSIDKAQIKEFVTHSRTQTSRSTAIDMFGITPAEDLLRAVTGESVAFPFTTTLSGEASLHFSSKLDFESLGEVSEKLIRAYRSKKYRQNFEWVDNMQPVRDKTIRTKLDDLLVQAIAKGVTGKMHLAPPEITDWNSVDEFSYSNANESTFPDIVLSDYLAEIKDLSSISLEKLKRDRVQKTGADDGEFIDMWSVYRCLVFETNYNGKLFILALGNWYAINTNYAKRVRDFVKSIPVYKTTLPNANIGESEGDFNLRVATNNSKSFVLLDKQNIRPDGATSPIEPCDLLTNKGEFIHVKKRHSSSTLSHLFAQGRVSAQTLLSEASFLEKINQKISSITQDKSFLIDTNFDPTKSAVVFAILTKNSKPLHEDLPFFSLVNLMQTTKEIRSYRFQVQRQSILIK